MRSGFGRLWPGFLALALVLFAVPAHALERVVDNAGLLTDRERGNLSRLADAIAAGHGFDLVILTEKNIGNLSLEAHARDFFSYSVGGNRDGAVLLVVAETGAHWLGWFDATGRANRMMTPFARNRLETTTARALGRGNHGGASRAFLQTWERFLRLDARGRSYNFLRRHNLALVAVGWVLALMIGFFIVRLWKHGMNTVLPKTHACEYVVQGSLGFKQKKDRFLYSTVTKIPRADQSSTGSGSRGRSRR